MRLNRSEPGIVLSSVAHAALFVFVIVGFAQPNRFSDQEESIPVEVVSDAELRQMTRGRPDASSAQANPAPQAQRVAETNEAKPDAPLAQREVEAPAGPPPSQEKAAADAREEKARADAEARAKVEAEVKAAQVAAEARARAETAERSRQQAAAELARQAAQKAAEEEDERKRAEEERQRKAAEARQAADAKARRDAEAKALREKIEREQQEAEERTRKAAEAKRLADERAKKTADEKARREAEAKAAAQQAEQKPFNPTDIARLLQNKQPAQTTGATGPQIQQQASLGAPNASAPKLSPSDKASLIGYLQAKMRECISVPPGSNRSARPEIRVILNRDGTLMAPPALVGGDRALGEAAVRGIRACAPYPIPERFRVQYDEWKSLLITLDASDLN